DKATSNICTAQVLLAVMAGMYGVYHGPKGLRHIAQRIHQQAVTLGQALEKLGYTQRNSYFFDTIRVSADAKKIKRLAEKLKYNFYYPDADTVSISINEITTEQDINEIVTLFAVAASKSDFTIQNLTTTSHIPESLVRTTEFLTVEVFNSYHSETEMMRYIKKLERKDLALNHSMIALGSC